MDKQQPIETPYDDDVRDLAQENGLSLNQARDFFIWIALQRGDVDPLIGFLGEGDLPGLVIRQLIALMMLPDEGLSEELRKEVAQCNYRFEIKSRSGKRRGSFRTELRNVKYAKRVAELINKHGRGSYDAAIKKVATETGVSDQTIRKAYDWARKSSK